jgi:hypothetical protein
MTKGILEAALTSPTAFMAAVAPDASAQSQAREHGQGTLL